MQHCAHVAAYYWHRMNDWQSTCGLVATHNYCVYVAYREECDDKKKAVNYGNSWEESNNA